ncbi:MAG: hypothetical protein II970_00345 [Paludibacteraceae bacterium]|nr:hypothetical protein [Paludibacteraceae bacterium]
MAGECNGATVRESNGGAVRECNGGAVRECGGATVVRAGEGYVVCPARLEQGRHEFDFVLDDEWLRSVEKSELLGGRVAVHASLLTGGAAGREGSLLSVHVKGTVQVTCDRCLEPADVETDASDELVLEEREEKEGVDLAWAAYETVSVNLPLVHCHPAGGCNPAMDALLQDHLCSAAEEPEE